MGMMPMEKLSNKEKFEIIQQQKKQKIISGLLAQEMFYEEAYLGLVSLNKKDVLKNDKAIKLQRSIYSHMANWYKSMNDNTKDYKFLLCGIQEVVDDFQNYLISKTKGQKEFQYNAAFTDKGFMYDLKKLIILKAYEHKWEMFISSRDGFCSKKACNIYSGYELLKENRGQLHESVNSLKKRASRLSGGKDELSPKMLNQLTEAFREEIEDICGIKFQKLRSTFDDYGVLEGKTLDDDKCL